MEHEAQRGEQKNLDDYATGKWDSNSSPLFWNTSRPFALHNLDVLEARSCLKDRWIYVVGDSSMRMFYSALIAKINSTLEDDRFGSYKVHDKGGCTGSLDESSGHDHPGCFREFVRYSVRLTFCFQAFGEHKNVVLQSLLSPSQVPDLVVLVTGAWDVGYHSASVETAVRNTVQMIQNVRELYSGTILWASLNTCPPFQDSTRKLNLAQHDRLQSMNSVFILNRQSSTEFLVSPEYCEGYHAYKTVVELHVSMMLNFVCCQKDVYSD